jgi:hypothetical protein
MREVITNLIDVPFARMFVLSGIVFLIIAVMGKIEGKIDPGNVGRVGASVLGIALLIIGITMQYIEIREISLERAAQQSRMQSQNAAAAPADSMAAKQAPDASAKQAGVPDAPSADKPTIKMASATYGRNCNARAGNATQQMAKACDGKTVCDYAVEPVELENAPANCVRDFAAEWKCGTGSALYTAILPAGAGKDEKLHLTCAL